MMKVPLSSGRWNKLKNVLNFSESNIKKSCIGESTLRLKGCINDIFNKICYDKVYKIKKKKKGSKWSIYERRLREVSLNGLPYWLTGIFVFFKSYSEALQRQKNQLNCMLTLRL